MASIAVAPSGRRHVSSSFQLYGRCGRVFPPGGHLDRPYQNTGVVVQTDRILPRADTWLRLLRSLQQANLRWYEDPKLAMFVLMKYTKQSDPDVLQKTYDFETNPPGFTKDLKVSDAGVQGILDFLAATVRPEAAKAAPKQFYNTTILDKLAK